MASPYQSPATEDPCVFRFSDALPAVCLVCGEPATGQTSVKVDSRRDTTAGLMSILRFVSLRFSFVRLWGEGRTSTKRTGTNWIRLPHCNQHNNPEELKSKIAVVAIDAYRAEISGACDKFREALQSASEPPSSDFLAGVDSGPAASAEEFFSGIDESKVQTSEDFLRKMGGQDDA